jgi:hypothetical protein
VSFAEQNPVDGDVLAIANADDNLELYDGLSEASAMHAAFTRLRADLRRRLGDRSPKSVAATMFKDCGSHSLLERRKPRNN